MFQPRIECVMHEGIGQDWRYHAPNAMGNLPVCHPPCWGWGETGLGRDRRPLRLFFFARHQGPSAICTRAVSHRCDRKEGANARRCGERPLSTTGLWGTLSKKARMSILSCPVLSPTPPTCHRQCVMGTVPRTGQPEPLPDGRSASSSIAARGLSDAVRRVRHTQHPEKCLMVFRYLHRPHRPRKIASRAHPVPQLEEVIPLRRCWNRSTPTASAPGAPRLARTFSHAP